MEPSKTASWGVGQVSAEAEAHLVRRAGLPAELADELHPFVRDKFKELWNAAQGVDPY